MSAESTPFPTSSEAGTDSMTAAGRTPRSVNGLGNEPETALDERAERAGAARAEDLISRIAQTAHETIDRLAESATPHVSRWQEGISGAGESLQLRADQVREMSDEWAESLRTTVRENPLAAVGVALAVGVLVARLSR
jgi:ElaB/YqjD/DUF883 family membrane-anchored ribosome-binding protein